MMSNATEDQNPTASTVINRLDSSQENSVNSTNDDKVTGGSSETVAKGIYTMLATVMRDFDSKAVDASHSQDKLFSALDRLTAELDQLLEDAPLPFIMQHAAKLSSVRKRVSSLNALLRSIQRRVDSIDRMLSVGMPNDKSNLGVSK